MTEPTPEVSVDHGPALDVAREFVSAVAWGEHRKVWDLLGPEGRKTVLRVAVNHGMDEALAARLRDGTAAKSETDEFLVQLVNGLRADLQGSDLDALEYSPDPAPEANRTRVVLVSPLPLGLADSGAGLPIGSLEMAADSTGQWRVERLLPNVSPA
ncbi:MAG TPA: hypothetical protein VMZ51_09490 [Acidimicrobiales bacterium]|nr:hypothetical protein [Acidimicrobiales bacterium]